MPTRPTRKNARRPKLHELAKEMNARFEAMGSQFQRELRGVQSQFGKIEKQMKRNIKNLQKSASGLFEYVDHRDRELQEHK